MAPAEQLPPALEDPLVLTAVIVGVIVLAALVIWAVIAMVRRRRRKDLRQRFGQEYDATVGSANSRRAAVNDLAGRHEEHDSLVLRELTEEQRDSLRRRMATLQYRFVEDPGDVMLETERAVVDALRWLGYPVAQGREQALRLLSVDVPEHTPALRRLLSQETRSDVAEQRQLFLSARAALGEVARISWSPVDATDPLPETPAPPPPPGGASAAEPAPESTERAAPHEGEREQAQGRDGEVADPVPSSRAG